MARRRVKQLFVGLAVVFCSLCSAICAQATNVLYDDFNDGVIGSNWIYSNSNTTFQEHSGKLYFSESIPAGTTQPVPLTARLSASPDFLYQDVWIGLEFYNFSSTNSSTGGLGSSLQLTMGPYANHVSIKMEHKSYGSFLTFDHFEGATRIEEDVYNLYGVDFTTGKLGLHYDGSLVYAAYSESLGQDAIWQLLGDPIDPDWNTSVRFSISGNSGGSGSTSFQVDNVGYSVPDPYSLILLLPGLIGILVLRKEIG